MNFRVLMLNEILLAGFFSSLVISLFAIPSIIRVAQSKGLYGIQRENQPEKAKVPTLGGLAIFAGAMIPLSLFSTFTGFHELSYLITGAVMLFFIGLKDDILVIAPWWKLLGQLLVALVISIPGELRISDPGSLLGLHLDGETFEVLITVIVIIVLINSYNLIDGIDGLAAGIGLLCSTVFGIVFYKAGLTSWTLLATIFIGSLAGFTWYNVFSRSKKIYMGDTGSLLLGFLMALMVVRFLNLEQAYFLVWQIKTPLAFILAVLVVPLFDTLRIVIVRIIRRRSPLQPDRMHIHYRLVDVGLTHLQSSGILLGISLAFIFLVVLLQGLGEIPLIIVLLISATIISLIPGFYLRKKTKF
ncbi:MraY family glycosyltransferase [Bacteroidota bacterium]